MNIRNLSQSCLLGIATLACATPAISETFPSRPVRIVVTSAPGGLLDSTTRVVAQLMSRSLGQSVIVENKSGAGGTLAIRDVKSSPADGYTLVSSTSTIAIQQSTMKNPGYNLLKDFTGIGPMTRFPLLLMVGRDQQYKTLPELISYAKAHPGEVSFASSGVGASIHLATASFAQRAGIDLRHIPYKGNSLAWPDVIAGRVAMIFEGYGTGLPMVKDGRMRALAVTSEKRIKSSPDIPTVAEQGLPNYSNYLWLGLFAPAGTPTEVVDRLSQALRKALIDPKLTKRFEQDGEEAMLMSPSDFNKFVAKETGGFAKLVADLGIPKH